MVRLILPRTTERPGRESGDEPRSKFVTSKLCVACPEHLERGGCSELPRREAPQRHARKSVVRGLPFFFALLYLSVPEGSAGEKGDLGKLSGVRIVVEDSNSHMREMGLTEDTIKKQVFDLLLGKLPRLAINDSAKSFVYINVNVLYGTMGSRRKYYFGNVNVQVKQPVIKKNTGKEVSASVWSVSHVVTGPPRSAPDHVRSSLETILTTLAADWYQDNPSR